MCLVKRFAWVTTSLCNEVCASKNWTYATEIVCSPLLNVDVPFDVRPIRLGEGLLLVLSIHATLHLLRGLSQLMCPGL